MVSSLFSHQGDFVEGVVGRVNERGIQFEGSSEWLNVSKYAKPAPKLPKPGEHVQLTLDGQGYIRTVDVLHDEARARYEAGPPDDGVDIPPPEEPSRQVERNLVTQHDQVAPDKDTQIRRMNALSTATAILSSGGRACEPDDVLALAAQLEAWVGR
jgi:hypothetical protein